MRKWAIILLPILVGLGLWLIFNSGWLANPIVYLRADVGLLLLIVGLPARDAGSRAPNTRARAHFSQDGPPHRPKRSGFAIAIAPCAGWVIAGFTPFRDWK